MDNQRPTRARSIGLVPLLVVVAVAPACVTPGGEDTTAWGPLAVVNQPPNGDFARTEGVVRLTDECAMLEVPNGDVLLLVWPADATTWQAESETILYRGFGGGVVEVGDGQEVVLSGSGEPFVGPEVEVTMTEWVAAREWEAAPRVSCAAVQTWSIGEVVLSGG